MTLATTTKVGDLASKLPSATRIFEGYGIDYCCGGDTSIGDACAVKGINVEEVIRALELAATSSDPATDYTASSQRGLVVHILGTHHVFTRYELARLSRLFEKVVSVHGMRHPELLSVQELFRRLYNDLSVHMSKEEHVLFPYLIEMESAFLKRSSCGVPPFGSVRYPVNMMMLEHDSAGELLRELRSRTSDYTAPADACTSYRALYAALADFERDLHRHMHLESNILFPRGIEMEAKVLGKTIGA
jgi:regulator of cell morphogenesis and NO signaling